MDGWFLVKKYSKLKKKVFIVLYALQVNLNLDLFYHRFNYLFTMLG